jgi:hypothetical protein
MQTANATTCLLALAAAVGRPAELVAELAPQPAMSRPTTISRGDAEAREQRELRIDVV